LHLRPRPEKRLRKKNLSKMPSNTKEVALEDAIERVLTDKHGYVADDPNDFDKEFVVDTARFWHFLETTQPAEIKKLQGVMAVQALSRLNRGNKKLGKRPEDLFVLDFFNQAEEIKVAFDPFYTSTSLSGPTDVGVLHDLMDMLESFGVYTFEEAIHFTEQYFKGVEAEQRSPLVDAPAERFDRNLEDAEKADFKIKAKQFVKVYGQMASIIDFQVRQWGQLYWFLKFLIPKLRVPNADDGLDDILDSVDLSTYGLERTRLDQPILLDEEGSEVDPQNPNPRGAHTDAEEEEELDLIIRCFNEKYFADRGGTAEEQRVKFISLSHTIRDHVDFEPKVANNPDQMTSELAFKKIVDEVMARQRRQDIELYKLFAKDDAFASSFVGALRRVTGS
jgi:type I restriction enzyme R subunit